jgi:phosphopantothenoylcysteine decarboxylase / phosphopantothenate---cysteine ligase
MLDGRRIVIGVTGGIAAYKTCELVRLCMKAGAEVRVVMTANAKRFVTPVTFEALTRSPVLTWSLDGAPDYAQNGGSPPGERLNEPGVSATGTQHIELARWAEIVFIAPATANILAKAAYGLADDFLSTLILATEAPVVFAPAMNTTMWKAAATQRNVKILSELGHTVLPTAYGRMAEPETGQGRMLEPEELFDRLVGILPGQGPLAGRRVIVTAGPTPEPIDPVRIITNRSSGKMGAAVAEIAVGMGADVIFIHGPITAPMPAGCSRVAVDTVEEMHDAVMESLSDSHALVMTAAVADYRPAHTSAQKIKKSVGNLSIELIPTTDILSEVSKHKDRQVIVGFAMETDRERAAEHVADRMRRKDLDFVALNMIDEEGAGFAVDTNRVRLFHRGGDIEELPLMSKRDVAAHICEAMLPLIRERYGDAAD